VSFWVCGGVLGIGKVWKEECELLARMSCVLVPLYSLMCLEVLTASCPCTSLSFLFTSLDSAVSHSEFADELLYRLCGHLPQQGDGN
jgi:hypothetical protein